MMRFCALLLISALAVSTLFAAEPAKLPEPFRSIADLASAAPPEFAADALLRIVESGKLADKNARRQLVEQAFRLAASARFPVRMVGLPGTITDTRSGSLSQAYALRLDVSSLQSRAVRDMLPLDAPKTRELFGQIVKPTLAPLTCDDALVYDPSEFYSALTAVVNGAFTPKEKTKEEHLNLILDALGQASSPSEIGPLARVVQSAAVTDGQRDILWTRVSALVEGMRPDERSASAAVVALSDSGLPAFAQALREKSRGCETDAPTSAPGAQQPTKPATPKLDPYWQSTTAMQLLDAGKKLRYASSDRLYSETDRQAQEWQQKLTDYLNLIADWPSDQEPSEAVYFHERCLVYTSLLDLVPLGGQSDKILAEYVDFVGNSSLYQQSPAEWFEEPHTLLDRSFNSPPLHDKVLDAFQRSGNPVLALAVALEKNFSNGLPSWAANAK